MIRFIEVGGQICEGDNSFSFYDTVKDEYIGWVNCYTWEWFDEFLTDYCSNICEFPIERFEAITPSRYFKGAGK